MQKHKLDNFTKGWFVGNFEPSLHKTEAFEVGVKSYRRGEHEPAHHHQIATEFTLIVDGEATMNGQPLSAGDIVEIRPNESTDFLAVTDVKTLVVKIPCAPNDKYLD